MNCTSSTSPVRVIGVQAAMVARPATQIVIPPSEVMHVGHDYRQ